jgi:DNA-directed RNA polymerase specialized sigma24 family protein
MGELYLRYYMLVFNKCLSFSKDTDDAGDLAHDVMLRVMEKIQFIQWQFKIFDLAFQYHL